MDSKHNMVEVFLRPFPGFQFYFWSMIAMIVCRYIDFINAKVVLNCISPSDGRGDSLLAIAVNKALNRPRLTQPTGEWSYTVGNFTYNYPKHELHFDMKATENIVAKCLVIDIDTFEQQDDLIAKSTSAFFLHENRDEHVFISYNLRLDSEYQVVCKLYAVTRKENEEKYYSSDLLTITDESVSFTRPRLNEETGEITFLVYNNKRETLHIIPNTQDYSPRRNYLYHLLLCDFSDSENPPSRETLIKQEAGIYHAKDVLPMTIKIMIPYDESRNKLWCILRRKDESREIYTDIVEQPYLVNP